MKNGWFNRHSSQFLIDDKPKAVRKSQESWNFNLFCAIENYSFMKKILIESRYWCKLASVLQCAVPNGWYTSTCPSNCWRCHGRNVQ